MVEIIPAVMPESLEDLSLHATRVKGRVPLMQIDVVDGVYAPRRTWPYNPRGIEEFSKIISEEEGLPFWDVLDYEIDLMVHAPESVASEWIIAGARRLIFHIGSTNELDSLLSRMEVESGKGSAYPVEIGLALGIDIPLETLNPFLSRIDFVQLMGINRIGFQGEEFDERVLPRLSSLRQAHPELILSVDGGVHLDVVEALVKAGANRLVCGSEIFNAPSVEEDLKQLNFLINRS